MMTPADLDRILDEMQAKAAGNPDAMPGLITVQTDDWIASIAALSTRPKTLVDGIRIRDIKIAVGATETTAVLTRAEAGERGEPYRDLAQGPETTKARPSARSVSLPRQTGRAAEMCPWRDRYRSSPPEVRPVRALRLRPHRSRHPASIPP
jgi:hypothetical protein